ncbi:hypothetical protein [Embleya sp. NPDC050493]|uniref:hypothetical protein n=1 Tax=Embleya sp. NPDC050493 TaxID=3363989 RepID=UPI00379B7F0E
MPVEAADTGRGIRADELPAAWKKLVRGSDARGTPGSGLGPALLFYGNKADGSKPDIMGGGVRAALAGGRKSAVR